MNSIQEPQSPQGQIQEKQPENYKELTFNPQLQQKQENISENIEILGKQENFQYQQEQQVNQPTLPQQNNNDQQQDKSQDMQQYNMGQNQYYNNNIPQQKIIQDQNQNFQQQYNYMQPQCPPQGYFVCVQYPNQPMGYYVQPPPGAILVQQPYLNHQPPFNQNISQFPPYQQMIPMQPIPNQPQSHITLPFNQNGQNLQAQGDMQNMDNNSTDTTTCSTNNNNSIQIDKQNKNQNEYKQQIKQFSDNKQIQLQNQNEKQISMGDIEFQQILAPDRQNKWIIPFLKYKKIRDLFPIELQSGEHEEYYEEIFQLKDKKNPLSIKINFQSKEEYNQKAIVLKEKKRSKFHNKNKLFFNSIIKIFKKKLLQKLNIPDKLFDAFYSFVEACRNTGRRFKDNKVSKTDLFNHSHYVLLFLTLNKKTIQQISEDQQYLKIHQDVTQLDLSKHVTEEDIQYINFMKICTYQVLSLHMRELMIGTREQQCEEREYDFRAFQGILEMIKGRHRDRF